MIYLLDNSPDRTELLMYRYLGSPTATSTCELWVAPLVGGSPRRLGNLVSQLGGAAWSPDGQQIGYARDRELHLARSDGTEIRKLATVGLLNFVRWSPDGDRIRFSVSEAVTASSLWE